MNTFSTMSFEVFMLYFMCSSLESLTLMQQKYEENVFAYNI